MKFKKGQAFKAKIPFGAGRLYKIHILYVLKSIYDKEQLIIYKVFGKHKRYWHEFMCTNLQMETYINNV